MTCSLLNAFFAVLIKDHEATTKKAKEQIEEGPTELDHAAISEASGRYQNNVKASK